LFCSALSLLAVERPSIKVFILAGQSNMEGKAKVSLLEHQVQQPATRDLFSHWQQKVQSRASGGPRCS